MKIIFAFRTRLPFRLSLPSLSLQPRFRFRKNFLYLLCSCQSSLLITVPRLQPLRSATLFFAWGTFRFRRFLRSVRFSPSRFLPSLRLATNKRWWAQMDSDHRPHAYQACALTS